LDAFARDKKRADGLQLHCKPCQKAYREANRERIAEQNAAWRKANPDKVREHRRKRRARPEVKAARAEYNKAWKDANPEKVREQTLRSYARNAEKRRAAARAAYQADPEAHQARTRRWREANAEKIAEYRRQNRQADRDYYARNAERIREKKEARRQWCVYKITFPDGFFYLGSSCHYDLRFNAHKSLARRQKHISALSGRDFDHASVEVVVLCQTEADALDLEAHHIEVAMTQSPNKCLNTTIPGSPNRHYWVYVIQSEAPRVDRKGQPRPGFFYVGMTTDPARRLRAHNGEIKGGGKYTSKHRPWAARALYGPYGSRSEALRAEYALKRQKRGAGRLKWSSKDSSLCRGDGPSHPWVSDPRGWRPPKP
jgi:predicted GIY-YIG superfamily endonuclease